MQKFKNKYRIEPIRLQHWDYSSPGLYFITICIANRENLLGSISNGEMILSKYGEIVKDEILNIPEYNQRIILDEWVVMPNHIHLLIELCEYGYNNGHGITNVEKIHKFSLQQQPSQSNQPHWCNNPNHTPTMDEIKQYRKYRRQMIIPKTVGKMKMLTSKQINIIQNTPGNINWQHDYHEHVIRSEHSYFKIKEYM